MVLYVFRYVVTDEDESAGPIRITEKSDGDDDYVWSIQKVLSV